MLHRKITWCNIPLSITQNYLPFKITQFIKKRYQICVTFERVNKYKLQNKQNLYRTGPPYPIMFIIYITSCIHLSYSAPVQPLWWSFSIRIGRCLNAPNPTISNLPSRSLNSRIDKDIGLISWDEFIQGHFCTNVFCTTRCKVVCISIQVPTLYL